MALSTLSVLCILYHRSSCIKPSPVSIKLYLVLQATGLPNFETLSRTHVSLRTNQLAFLVSNDKHDDDDLAGHLELQQLTNQCGLNVQMNVYNNALMGWEPLLEPWTCSVASAVPLSRYVSCHVYLNIVVNQLSNWCVKPDMGVCGASHGHA